MTSVSLWFRFRLCVAPCSVRGTPRCRGQVRAWGVSQMRKKGRIKTKYGLAAGKKGNVNDNHST
ncbi:hypothetical protein APED_19540 [Acanthopleuribacter pedis]